MAWKASNWIFLLSFCLFLLLNFIMQRLKDTGKQVTSSPLSTTYLCDIDEHLSSLSHLSLLIHLQVVADTQTLQSEPSIFQHTFLQNQNIT